MFGNVVKNAVKREYAFSMGRVYGIKTMEKKGMLDSILYIMYLDKNDVVHSTCVKVDSTFLENIKSTMPFFVPIYYNKADFRDVKLGYH